VATHPLWRPFELVDLDTVDQVVVGDVAPTRVVVVPYDEGWPARFEALDARIRTALGERVVALSHVGSTSVPGLHAKPVIDADLTVASSADEEAYLPDLEAAGFVLRVREPEWEEHRMLTTPERDVNLHVFSPSARELRRHLLFRDWLRQNAEDRDLYAATKLEVASRGYTRAMEYNNHKGAVVYDIYERAFAADPAHPHDPRPRA
jgi:GrpB-like predicted nucleotidyltransferase (UPF0157 family)